MLVTWVSLGSMCRLLPGTASNVSQCVGADQELEQGESSLSSGVKIVGPVSS